MESTVLGSRYELLERVGMGGMAVVYKAKDKMLNRFVAVKILREEFKENEDFIRRFKIESQAAASLSHQNIAQIYDVGEENGMNYIVMEFLEGVTLKKHILDSGTNLSRKEAMNYSMQICRALEHAHSKYVVHRDIKPQNIVITESGKLKLADFGIARAANNTTTVNSKNNMAVGSAHYLSPEQARGGYTDHRSDIYSLGIVMYEMFCGRLPFDAEESVSVVMKHLHEEPVRPCEVNPDLPAGIEAIILKAMKKEQRLRYENATQILEDLVLVYQNPSIDVSELNAFSEEDNTSVGEEAPPKRHHRPAHRHKKKKGVSKALIAVLVLFSIAILSVCAGLYLLFNLDTGEEVEIPDFEGMTFDEAVHKAEKASTDKVKFTVLEGNFILDNEPRGTIISQDPIGGGKVKKSRQIKVDISKGPAVVELEDYSGRPYDLVKEKLEKLGVKVTYEEKRSSTETEGIILDQNPKEGTKLAEGEAVIFYVSIEQTYTYVPNFIEMTEKEAVDEIEHSDFYLVEIIEDRESNLAKGIISKQYPLPKEKVPTESGITLYVSTGENHIEGTEIPEEKPSGQTNTEKKETVTITLTNLDKNKAVRVRIVGGGVTVFEKDITTSTGNETVTFEVSEKTSFDIYYDGKWIREV